MVLKVLWEFKVYGIPKDSRYGPEKVIETSRLTSSRESKGDKGRDGEFGGAIFEFIFDTGTSETDDSTSGKIRFNDQIAWDSTKLMIDISSNKDKGYW